MSCSLYSVLRNLHSAIVHHRQPAGLLYASRSAVADSDLSILYDDRYVPRTLGELQHLFELGLVHLHIEKFSLVSEGLTSLDRIRSTLFPVNDDLAYHGRPPLKKENFYIIYYHFTSAKVNFFR